MLEFQQELEMERQKNLNLLHKEQAESGEREEHLKIQLDFVKNAFHSFKVECMMFERKFLFSLEFLNVRSIWSRKVNERLS